MPLTLGSVREPQLGTELPKAPHSSMGSSMLAHWGQATQHWSQRPQLPDLTASEARLGWE